MGAMTSLLTLLATAALFGAMAFAHAPQQAQVKAKKQPLV
jgi:hypothetical protein